MGPPPRVPLTDPQAREIVYGMPYDEWRKQCVAKALEPFPLAAGKKSQKLEKGRADIASMPTVG